MSTQQYALVIKCGDRLVSHESWIVMSEADRAECDAEALHCLGERLIREAVALRLGLKAEAK